jgi:O-antigen/teichoic acid export membrane protein
LILQRFANALQWNIGISAATIAIQVGITAIVARLLTPADFGVYAIANVAVIIGRHFGDRGLLSAIAREPDLDRETAGTAVTLACALSALLALSAAALAPLAASGVLTVDRSGLVEALLHLMSLSILISGIGAPAQAFLQRELRFRELGLIQAAGIVVGAGGVTIVFAAAGGGPWSLAFGDLANATIVCAGSWWMMRNRWGFAWHPRRLARLGMVSVQMTLLRVLDVMWTQVPLIVANARLSAFDVGLYQRSQTLVDLGVNSTTGRFNAVLFPILAMRQHRKDMLEEVLPPLVGLYALFLLPVTAFVALAAPDIVRLLLGARWEKAAEPLAIIMGAFAILHISQPPSVQLEVRALFAPRLVGSFVGAAVLGAGGLALVGKWGLEGIAMAAVVSAALTAAINFRASALYLGVPPSRAIAWILPGLGVAGLMAGAVKISERVLLGGTGSAALRLAVMGVVATVAFVVGFRLLVSEEKRLTLGRYLPSNVTWRAAATLKILGFEPPTA